MKRKQATCKEGTHIACNTMKEIACNKRYRGYPSDLKCFQFFSISFCLCGKEINKHYACNDNMEYIVSRLGISKKIY